MKVTVENKKGLNKDLKVFIDKKTISSYMDEKYEEVKNTVTLKGFRPGKVPVEIQAGRRGATPNRARRLSKKSGHKVPARSMRKKRGLRRSRKRSGRSSTSKRPPTFSSIAPSKREVGS